MKTISKRALLIAAGVVVLAGLIYLFLPAPQQVQTAPVHRGPLQVIVEEEGETQVVDRYVVTATVTALARRIELEVGDPVRRGEPIVYLEPPRSAILDPRSRVQNEARLEAARAALAQAQIAAEQAVAERERLERLHAAGGATGQALEQATAAAALALAARDAARAERDAAEAVLAGADGSASLPAADAIRAPADGRVLAVHQRSGGLVTPGQPLLEIGDTERLQVEAEVLSRDAVRIGPGTRVLIEEWGGEVIEAVVARVDPQGLRRVSALGVEERRVRVVADITSAPEAYRALGPGYRVLARFVIWEAPDVLQVPTAALFRQNGGWAVFVVEDLRARLRPVSVGRQAGLATQVLEGLESGEIVIIHPGGQIEEGVRVRFDQS